MEGVASYIVSEKLGERVLGTDLQTNISMVRLEIERLSNAILHLRRSNEELQGEDPNDPDFMEAINENTAVIKKYTNKIAELMELLEALQGFSGSNSCGTPDVSDLLPQPDLPHQTTSSPPVAQQQQQQHQQQQQQEQEHQTQVTEGEGIYL
jgi:hypothetical protein